MVSWQPFSRTTSAHSRPVRPVPTITAVFPQAALPVMTSSARTALAMPGMEPGTTGGAPAHRNTPTGAIDATIAGVASVLRRISTPNSRATSARTSVTPCRLPLKGGSLATFSVPPSSAAFSSSVTAKPRLARMMAHSSPAGPPPTTTTERPSPFFCRSCQR